MHFTAFRLTLATSFLAQVVLAAPDTAARLHPGARRIHRELKPEQYCNNTVQGRGAVTDDQGFYCTRDNFNSQTGCCTRGQQYSCETCSSDNLCCEEYERCVSCCLSPSYRAKDWVQAENRSPGRPDTGRWASAFDLCKGKCRTTAHSTVHENAYLSGLHHCFSESGKPTHTRATLTRAAQGPDSSPCSQGPVMRSSLRECQSCMQPRRLSVPE